MKISYRSRVGWPILVVLDGSSDRCESPTLVPREDNHALSSTTKANVMPKITPGPYAAIGAVESRHCLRAGPYAVE
jgi:hypothetical protein